jgi:hypothetical protein
MKAGINLNKGGEENRFKVRPLPVYRGKGFFLKTLGPSKYESH